jgi:ribonuclease R
MKAFNIKRKDRVDFKKILKEMDFSHIPQKKLKRNPIRPDKSPLLHKGTIIAITQEGDLLCQMEEESQEKKVLVPLPFKEKLRLSAKVGEQVILKISHNGVNLVRKLGEKPEVILGVFHVFSEENVVVPVSKKIRERYIIPPMYSLNAQTGDLVEIKLLSPSPYKKALGEVIRILGSIREPKSMSLIAIHTYDLPFQFPDSALHLAKKAKIPSMEGRTDLCDIPFVTIDDEDARDFDDAVWAEPDTDPTNPGGWHLIVAIADVSYYVKADDPLDREAFKRGNSVYFPDRVIPMLPEELSNHLCSLKPNTKRGCLAVHLWINQNGKLLNHQFVRGIMKSVKRLTYQETQEAFEGGKTRLTPSFIQDIICPLYGAYSALLKAKLKRSPLNLELPEEKIYLNEEGKITRISPRPRFDSHRLIEEFMITANVAAAVSLDNTHTLCMYRIHDKPSLEKLESLREFLQGVNLTLPKGQVPRPSLFNKILIKAKETPYEHAVNELVLRTQAQAVYSPANIGHFGLCLPRYAHFTSPIRRYADLLVHRGLIAALNLARTEEFSYSYEHFRNIGEHISMTERRAAAAENETIDRYVSAYLSENKGKSFDARITGVTDFALFVRIEEQGAEGIIPIRLLGSDYFIYDRQSHQLKGRRTKQVYALGEKIKVNLVDADPIKGSITFSPISFKKPSLKLKKDKKKRRRTLATNKEIN